MNGWMTDMQAERQSGWFSFMKEQEMECKGKMIQVGTFLAVSRAAFLASTCKHYKSGAILCHGVLLALYGIAVKTACDQGQILPSWTWVPGYSPQQWFQNFNMCPASQSAIDSIGWEWGSKLVFPAITQLIWCYLSRGYTFHSQRSRWKVLKTAEKRRNSGSWKTHKIEVSTMEL